MDSWNKEYALNKDFQKTTGQNFENQLNKREERYNPQKK